jgi:penicillin-binding protein 2
MNQKSLAIIFLILSISLIIIGRLFYLQIMDDEYKDLALKNAVKKEYIIPERGYIYDRNNNLLVSNLPVYDIMAVPKQIKAFDTTSFLKYTHLSKKDLLKALKKAKKYSWNKASLIAPKLYKDEVALLQEKIYEFPGFFIQRRAIRQYHTKSAANVLGFIREVNDKELKNDPFYTPGDLIGKSGVEKSYEKYLRGTKGVKYFLTDKFNRKIGPYKNGKYDTLAQVGKDLHLSIDIKLQEFGDSLMKGKRGAIIAIEPATGQILALVTAPSFPPEYLSGRNSSKNFNKLFQDKVNNPLLDRGLQGAYPPGSPFKMLNGLIGLQEGVIKPQTAYVCNHGFYYGKHNHMFCHCGANGKKVHLPWAIERSCNTYFSKTYLDVINKYPTPEEGLDVWHHYLKKFGLGQYLHTDLPVGSKGFIPDSKFYDRYYGKGKWYASYTISNGIGQGEVLTTPIQLANVTAAIANRGYFYTPHVVRAIAGNANQINSRYLEKHSTGIDQKYFEDIIKGMANVYKKGTAKYSNLKDIELCGKTGTSENKIRINGQIVKLPDHSIFMAFGPKDNPKIAVTVFVENGGYGATIAAPIATLMIEKYLRGHVTRTDLLNRMLQTDLSQTYQLKQYEKQ